MTVDVRIVADDLTGALDVSAQFTGRTAQVSVYRHAHLLPATGPFAIDLGTRDRSAHDAEAAARSVASALSGAELPFKKIDSLLRGPWAVELQATMVAAGFSTCVLAPAFPAQGRITVGGQGFLVKDGRRTALETDLVGTLEQLGLTVTRNGDCGQVLLWDAESDDELERIVRRMGGRDVLWCGSAGLARALAGLPPRRVAAGRDPLLLVVGSDHCIATEQVAVLGEALPEAIVTTGSSPSAVCRSIERRLADGSCLLTFSLQPMNRRQAAGAIEARLAAVLPHLQPPPRAFAMGGATATSLCLAVGARHLDCIGEVTPGVPMSRIAGGLWDGTMLITKAGAFGAPDALLRLINGTESDHF